MDYFLILKDIIHFLQLTLPLIFFGFLCANTLKASSYLDLAGLPMRSIVRTARLPMVIAPALTLFFLSSWSGMSMLSHFFREKKVGEKSVFISIMIAQFPKAIHSVFFFQGPLVFSLLGQYIGSVLIISEIIMNIFIAVLGIIVGRTSFKKTEFLELTEKTDAFTHKSIHNKAKGQKCIEIFKATCIEFFSIVKVLVPTGVLLIILIDMGINNFISPYLVPIMDTIHLPPFTLVVIASAFVSQIAVITSAGTLVAMDGVSNMQCLLILFIARGIHLSIGYLKTSLPTNISLFGPSFGPKITGFECILTESWIMIMIFTTLLFQ